MRRRPASPSGSSTRVAPARLGDLPRPGPRVRITPSRRGTVGLAYLGEPSMATYLEADRVMTVTTPLPKDSLLLAGFTGHEAISQLFEFRLDLLAENDTD